MFRKLSIALLLISCFVASVSAIKNKKHASQKQKTVKLEPREASGDGIPAFVLDAGGCGPTAPPSFTEPLFQRVLRKTLRTKLATRVRKARARRHQGRTPRDDAALRAALVFFAEMDRCDTQRELDDMQSALGNFSLGAGGAEEDHAADG